MTSIILEGGEELIAKLTRLEQMRRVKSAILAGATELEGYAKQRPGGNQHRPNPMLKVNAKMRRGFFAKLKAGEIEVPYRRGMSPQSKNLQKSWTTEVQNQGWRAVVGTNVSYARLVQDSAQQTKYHQVTGWQTTDQIVKQHGKEIMRNIQNALKQEIENG